MFLVSVIVPACNVEKYLFETCSSVLNQTVSYWECIIVDDGSTDGTNEIANKFCNSDPRFRLIRECRSGVSVARNKGLSECKGEFVCFLDADDLLEPTALEDLMRALNEAPKCILSWGKSVRFVDERGEIKQNFWKNYLATGCAWYDMLIYDFIPMGSFCISKSLLSNAHRFQPGLSHAEDRDFLLKVLKGNTIVAVDAPVLRIRVRESSASSNYKEALDSEIIIMQKHIEDTSIPAGIKRRARSALAFRCAVIEACTARQYVRALYWYLMAVVIDPLNINNYLLPLRKFFKIV